jgi:hypothetical protein
VGPLSGKMRVLVSMYDRWLAKPELVPKDKVRLCMAFWHI